MLKNIPEDLKKKLESSLRSAERMTNYSQYFMSRDSEFNILDNDSRRDSIESKYLAQSTRRSTIVGSPVESQLMFRVIQPAVSSLSKKMLRSRVFGQFQPSAEIANHDEQIAITEAATEVIHHDFKNNKDFAQFVTDVIRSTLLYPVTCVRSQYMDDIVSKEERHENVSEEQLFQLENDPTYEIVEIIPNEEQEGLEEEALELQFEDQLLLGITYTVIGNRLVDKSRTENDMIRYYDLVVDKSATSFEDNQLIGESVKLTKDQFLEKYQTENWEDFDPEKYWQEEDGEHNKRVTVMDVHTSVRENDQTKIYHVIAIEQEQNICYLEDVGFMPYTLIRYDSIPGTLTGTSVAERIQQHDAIATTLTRTLASAALESSSVQKVVKEGGARPLAQVVGKENDRSVKVVGEGGDVNYIAAPFPADVITFMNESKEEALAIGGTGGEYDPPSSSNISVYESVIREENAASVNDMRLTILGEAFCNILQNNYRLLVKYADSKAVFNPRSGQIVNYDLTMWPSEMRMDPKIGYGRGMAASDIVAIEKMIAYQYDSIQRGIPLASAPEIMSSLHDYADALGVDGERYFQIPEEAPGQDDDAAAAQNAIIQLEQQKLQLQAQNMQLDIQLKQIELELKREEASAGATAKQQEIDIKQQEIDFKYDKLALEKDMDMNL